MIHSTVIFSLKPVSDHSCLVDGAFEILEEPHMFRHCLEGSSFSFNWPPICTSWGHIFFKNPTCKEMEQPFKARCRTTAYNMISSLSPLLCLCCSRCPPEAVYFLSLMFPSFADITVSTRRLAEWTKITRSPSASGPVHQITSKQPSWVKMDVRVFWDLRCTG